MVENENLLCWHKFQRKERYRTEKLKNREINTTKISTTITNKENLRSSVS
jgi:hypothetical protein